MSITVTATAGAIDANSYQTVADVDDYFSKRAPIAVSEDWGEAEPEEKAAAVITATTWMESFIVWTGYVTSLTQALQWPRNSMVRRDGMSYVPSTEIPRELKNAHAELSRLFLTTDRTEESEVSVQGLTYLRASDVTLKFKDNTIGPQVFTKNIAGLLVSSWYTEITGIPQLNRDLLRS